MARRSTRPITPIALSGHYMGEDIEEIYVEAVAGGYDVFVQEINHVAHIDVKEGEFYVTVFAVDSIA
jgi:hypothetical protein